MIYILTLGEYNVLMLQITVRSYLSEGSISVPGHQQSRSYSTTAALSTSSLKFQNRDKSEKGTRPHDPPLSDSTDKSLEDTSHHEHAQQFSRSKAPGCAISYISTKIFRPFLSSLSDSRCTLSKVDFHIYNSGGIEHHDVLS